MASHRNRFGPHNPDETYVPHTFPEQLADLGEVQMNYVTVGDAGIEVDYRSFETMGHSMHGQDPQLFTETVVDWTTKVRSTTSL